MPSTLEKVLPSQLLNIINFSLYFFKKELPSLQFHLTDHCNLNCKGCGHYCPIVPAPYFYTDLQQHERDMRRLSQLFHKIHTIFLMGGEPLLHPDPASFITMTRYWFPKSELRFLTNGILLSKASNSFWKACQGTNTAIHVTVYPPLRKHVNNMRTLCDRHGVKAVFRKVNRFHAHRNLKGDTDKHKAFKACRKKVFCPLLKQGTIYTCPIPGYVHYFNERFNCQITIDKGIDIHADTLTARKILRALNRPIETCKWCSDYFIEYQWSKSNKLSSDWDSAEIARNRPAA